MAGQLMPRPSPMAPDATVHVVLRDGDELLLHVNEAAAPVGREAAVKKPVIMLLHGLGGSSESTYIVRLTAKLNALGHRVLRFNHRGAASGGASLARAIYHAGRTEDAHAALLKAQELWPSEKIRAAAFSLSANLLLKLLTERAAMRPLAQFERAVAVCPPIDLDACSRALDRNYNWHIDHYYTKSLISTAHAKYQLFPDTPPPVFPKRMSLRIFDEVYTAPRAGFRDRAAYYDASSAKAHLSQIEIPTAVIAAADDPIIPEESFTGAYWSSACQFTLEKSGGHLGFIGRNRTRFGDLRWMDEAVIDALLA